MSVPSSDASAAKTTSQSLPSSSTNTKTSSEADRGLFWASKFKNYNVFVSSLAEYIPEAAPWASSLRCLPLVAFKLQVSSYFGEAIEAHRRGDNVGRDTAASSVVREQARSFGLDLTKLRADDLVKLLRYGSLFSLLVAEDSA
jgi:hypothetical protein